MSWSIPNPPDLRHLSTTYLFLLVSGGQIGLPIIVFTVLYSRKLAWHPTLVNFCITWIIYSVVYCLYLYSGADSDNPHWQICLAQASMTHGAPPMAAVGGLSVVIHTWATIQQFDRCVLDRIPRPWSAIMIIVPPYLTFLAFSIGAGVLGFRNPQLLTAANGLYCTINHKIIYEAVPSFCTAVMSIVLCFEVAIGLHYVRRQRRLKHAFPLAQISVSKPSIFRIGLFCVYSGIALVAAIFFMVGVENATFYMFPAALPLASMLVFGMQEDIMVVWFSKFTRQKLPEACKVKLQIFRARPAPSQVSSPIWDCSSPTSPNEDTKNDFKIALASPTDQALYHWRVDTELAMMRILREREN
ncbi:hypothetical protein BJ138DRAFT_1182048 [Hygrophoropsis aurantiaca]|uniref:Uncharacterized protein n=1 Tax=Hygrophoropsis aurantiaca TaxID=72124 RepID=A0ACB8A489_9AGAM|nr:hypothetical protein BJ138DRAFT_1182048 [Hygrophoropsis aurantiaca]